jgi:DNA polymerase
LTHQVTLDEPDDFDGWRHAARALALAGVAPDGVVWRVAGEAGDLFGSDTPLPPPRDPPVDLRVPRAFLDLARSVVQHSDPSRFGRLYALLIRLQRQPKAIEDRADPALRQLDDMAKAVRRDIHKMRAFVRFRTVRDEDGERFVAWFEPQHHIVRHNARFFVDRFAAMRWSILTPALSIHWDGAVLAEGPGATRADAPADDPVETIWKTYYGAIFNPARVKIGAMLKEMPRKYWHNMAETALIGQLIAGAHQRESRMIDTAAQTSPSGNATAAIAALREEADSCRRCPLWQPATQTVFGEGPADATIMLVGEQPGDQEDQAGHPFVGPAGQMLDAALAEAGLDRAKLYVTNAVKHFKFEPRGKRRIHQSPVTDEIKACRWWLDQERAIVRPRLTIALGATAARALAGKAVTIGRERGRPVQFADGGAGWITVHPSYLLRLPDPDLAETERRRFVEDLSAARAWADANADIIG